MLAVWNMTTDGMLVYRSVFVVILKSNVSFRFEGDFIKTNASIAMTIILYALHIYSRVILLSLCLASALLFVVVLFSSSFRIELWNGQSVCVSA